MRTCIIRHYTSCQTGNSSHDNTTMSDVLVFGNIFKYSPIAHAMGDIGYFSVIEKPLCAIGEHLKSILTVLHSVISR